MKVLDNDITLAVAGMDIPEDIDREMVRNVTRWIIDEIATSQAHSRIPEDAGFVTMHLDSTGHYGFGDAPSCESWAADHSGVTFDLSVGAVEGRDIDQSPAEYVADAVVNALDEIAEILSV